MGVLPGSAVAEDNPQRITPTEQSGVVAEDSDGDGVTDAPDQLSAKINAELSGESVEDLSARDEFSQTFAKPDGSFETKTFAGLQRVQAEDGSWADVDPTLEALPGGGFGPKVAAADVVIGGGGRGVAADISFEDDQRLAFTVPQDLPPPTIDGAVATYKLNETTDLLVTALKTGVSVNFRVNERPAVGGEPDLTLGLESMDLEVTTSSLDGIRALDEDGKLVAASPSMVAWDAQTDEAGAPTNVVPVEPVLSEGEAADDGVTKQEMALTPQAGFLQDPTTQYPVIVDPTTVWKSIYIDTTVRSGLSNSFGTSAVLLMGRSGEDTDPNPWSSYVRFGGENDWMGQNITGARASFYQYAQGYCLARQLNIRPLTEYFNESTTVYSNRPASQSGYATSFADQTPGCAPGRVDLPVTGMVQAWASGTLSSRGMELSVPAGNSSDGTYSRRFCSSNEAPNSGPCTNPDNNPYLMVQWNSAPYAPWAPTIVNGMDRNGTFWANSSAPFVQSLAFDPDTDGNGDGIAHSIEVHSNLSNNTPDMSGYASCFTPWTASGEWGGCTPSSYLPNGLSFWARSLAHDAPYGTLNPSPWSPWFRFSIDSSTPPAPAINCSGPYANGNFYDTRTSTSIDCTATSSGAYDIIWNKNKSATPTTVAGGSVTIPVSVPQTGVVALDFTARSKSGNSTTSSYTFGVGTASILPVEEERTTTTVPMLAQSAPNAQSAKVQWRPAGAPDTAWVDAKKTNSTFDNVRSASTNALWNGSLDTTSISSTVDLVWSPNKEPNVTAPSHLESRVVFTYQNGLTKATPPRSVQVLPHAFGGTFPSQDFGPGQVALFTGEFQLSETDVDVPAYNGSLTLGRSHLSLGGATTGPSGVFGPGWSADFAGPDYGIASYTVDDRRAADGSIYITSPDGESYGYGKDDGSVGASITGRFNGLGEYAVDEDYLKVNDANTELTMNEADGTVTKFTKNGTIWLAQEVTSAEANSTVTYAYTGTNVSWIFAPKPAAMTTACTTAAQTAGCRALELVYTTVAGTTRVSEVKLHIWDPKPTATGTPGSAAMATVSVAKYSYTSDAKLSAAWDPRLGDDGTPTAALKTAYTYDTVGGKTVIKTVTPPGLKAWTINYDDKGRVKTITRVQDGAAVATDGAGSGPATWSVQYDLGLSAGGDGLPDLSPAATSTWGQPELDAPYGGAAVFGPDQVPGTTPTAVQYEYADLSYWTKSGRTSNTATYGAGAWQIDSTRYDDKGNPIWQLSPAGKAKVLAERAANPGAGQAEATRVAASKYATLTTYTTGDERRVTATYGPMSIITAQDTGAPANLLGRKLSRTVYDDTAPAALKPGYPPTGVPTGGFGLPVETTDRVTTGFFPYEPGSAGAPTEYDVDTTHYTYDPVVTGDGDGWVLKSPTRVLVKTGSDQWAITMTRFDTEGKVIETRTPEGTETTNGTAADTRSTKTTYYTVGANAADSLCGLKPEWAGMVCKTGPGGGAVPTTRITGYSMLLAPTRTEEAQGGGTRARVTSYDPAGRTLTSVTTTSGITPADRAVPAISTTYSAGTGLVTKISNGTPAQDQDTTYDTWGRVKTQTDGAGSTATTVYDTAGRVKTSNDGKATYTYTYNGTDSKNKTERRGLVTSVDVSKPTDMTSSASTTFTGAYDDSGALTEQNYPGGVKATWVRDLNGVETGLSYLAPDGTTPLLNYANTVDVDGRVVTQAGAGSTQTFAYDNRDRLTQVSDNRPGQCTVRRYTFSGDSNRKTLTTFLPGTGGACQTTTGSNPGTIGYNAADQLTADTYDTLGRTTTLNSGTGGAATIGYHANDMVATITQGTKKQDYTLDLAGRVSTVKNLESSVSLKEATNHYDGPDDSPAWTSTKTRPDAATAWVSTWERNVADLTGDLGLIQTSNGKTKLQLSNLHGDVAATYALGEPTPFTAASAVDEYGKPIGTPDNARYGWLGTKQRDATAPAGLTLMGARLYNPVTGRFLSRDPVPGGNDNAFGYPADPINAYDLDGRFLSWVKSKAKQGFNYVRNNGVKVTAYAAVGVGGFACGASVVCGAAVLGSGALVKYATSSTKKKTVAGAAGAVLGAAYYRNLSAPYKAVGKSVATKVIAKGKSVYNKFRKR